MKYKHSWLYNDLCKDGDRRIAITKHHLTIDEVHINKMNPPFLHSLDGVMPNNLIGIFLNIYQSYGIWEYCTLEYFFAFHKHWLYKK